MASCASYGENTHIFSVCMPCEERLQNRIKKLEEAIKFTLIVDAEEGYIMHPNSVEKLVDALKSN